MTGEMAELAGDAADTRAFWPAGSAGLPRVLPPEPVRDLAAHQGRYGVPGVRGTALIGEVERSGLTRRGGAAYPAGKKLRTVRERAGLRGAVVIANGIESEPAEATSARAAYLCVGRQAQADALAAAIAERGGYDPVPVQLALVPERYVSSAESSPVVPVRCLQHETDHLDGVLFSDRMDAATRKLAMREIQSIKVAYADEDEQASEDWPHTLTSGAGDRAPVYIAPEAAGNWAEVRVLARNDSFDRGGWLPCGTELRGRYAACHDGCTVAD